MDNFTEPKSKVYILTDNQNRVIRVEGGYTTPTDLTDWIKIDEGYGDKYNLCQTHYFDKPICDEMGLHNYMYENGSVREATTAELETELHELPAPDVSEIDKIQAQVFYTAIMTDTLLEEGE